MYGYHPNAITHKRRKRKRKLPKAKVLSSRLNRRRKRKKQKTKKLLKFSHLSNDDFIKHEPKYTYCLKKGIIKQTGKLLTAKSTRS
jgi:hypothetical protein